MNLSTAISNNSEYQRAIELHYKKNRTLTEAKEEAAIRRENPALDRMLYDVDKAEILGEWSAAKNLLMKLMNNEELTESEKEFLEENYPEYLEKAESMKSESYEKEPETEAELLRKRFEQQVQLYSMLDIKN